MLKAEFKIQSNKDRQRCISMIVSYVVDAIGNDAIIYRAKDMSPGLYFKVLDHESDTKLGKNWVTVGRRGIDHTLWTLTRFLKDYSIVVDLERDYSFSIKIVNAMGTKEFIETYLGRDEYEYVETICEQMGRQFPGVKVAGYNHLEKQQCHRWEFEFPGWENQPSGIVQGIFHLVRAIFEEIDDFDIQMYLTGQVLIVTQYYEG